MQWVIDTWVIAKCTDFTTVECLSCHTFLGKILTDGKIFLDSEGDIKKEYDHYIKYDKRSFLSWWWQEMIKTKGKIGSESNKLSNRHENHLLRKLHFDPSDIKFIGVASKTTDKHLITGDSDYNESVRDYLYDKLSIRVTCPKDALLL